MDKNLIKKDIEKSVSTTKKKKVAKKKSETIADFETDLVDFLSTSSDLEVTELSDHQSVPYWLDSGSYALNWTICDNMFGGVPGTKITLVAGKEATGKSMLTDFWLGQNVKAGGVSIKVDIEDAIEADFVAQIVGDVEVAKKIKLISPNTEKAIKKAKGNVKKLENKDLVITIEKLTTILNKLIDFQMSRKETKPICISIDSVSQLSSDKEVTDVKEENDKRDMTAQQNVRKLFRVINQKMRNANLSIFGIAHITTDINVKFGSNQVVSAKGSGFKYANSLTLQMVSTKAIEDKKTEVPIGIRFKIRTTKNRVAFKGRECFLYLYFNGGVDKYGGLLELLAQYDIVQPCAKQTKEDEEKGKEPKKQSPKYGVYPPTTVFWYKTDDKEPIKFTLRGIAKQVEDNGGGKLIQEWNTKLNKKYKDILKQQGLSPDDFLEEDDLEDEDDFLENLENSIE